MRASLPTTILQVGWFCLIKNPNAAVYFTMSVGVNASPAFPPIVPLIPEIDLIRVKMNIFKAAKISFPERIHSLTYQV